MGVGRGVGTTHLTIMIGNYLANGLGKKVALLELNKNNAYSEIKHMKCSKISKSCFEVKGMDFYENISYEDIPKIMANNYNYLILDVSSNYILGRNEFLRSHKKIVVGSLSKWKAQEYLSCFENLQLISEISACRFLSLSKDCEVVKMVKDKYRVQIDQIPLEENPFYIGSNHIEWIRKIIN